MIEGTGNDASEPEDEFNDEFEETSDTAEAPPTEPVEESVYVPAKAEHIPTTRGVGGTFRIGPDGRRTA